MSGPSPSRLPAREFDLDELTQEIDAPLDDFLHRQDEPTLSKLDFEDLELALDL